jgi:cytochrome c-type biogenesis protein CcmH/NrfG
VVAVTGECDVDHVIPYGPATIIVAGKLRIIKDTEPEGDPMSENQTSRETNFTSTQAYVLAAICLLVGIALGYFFRGSASPAAANASGGAAMQTAAAPMSQAAQQRVTPEQLKHMADTQAQPLLARLQSSPNDPALLAQIGNVYYDTQSYQEAIKYYDQSLKADPRNADVRTDLGTAYYYLGDADRALQEFRTVLKNDPKHGQTMFNMGMVQWQGKGDVKGAVEIWEHLLQTVPNFPDRAKVEQLVEKAKAHTTTPPALRPTNPQ